MRFVIHWLCLAFFLLIFSPVGMVHARSFQGSGLGDSVLTIKAAVVYKLTWYVSWPNNTSESRKRAVNICVLTNDPLLPFLEAIERDLMEDDFNVVPIDHLKDINSCDVLYLSRSVLSSFRAIPSIHGVLTMSDAKGFALKGGAVEISQKNEQLLFKINIGVLLDSGVKISSKVLNMSGLINSDVGGNQ